MCGIVGLFLKDKALESELGAMLAAMLGVMDDRGPDSAGFAIYGAGQLGIVKATLRGPSGTDFEAIFQKFATDTGEFVRVVSHHTHGVVALPADRWPDVRASIKRIAPELTVVGEGNRMELFKEVGLPSEVSKRFGLNKMVGTHGIGHTRMATESAVTIDGAHPFSTGLDQCLVHNGSLSNHNSVRRELTRNGVTFETENDSEVAAVYLSQRMHEGDSLARSLERSLKDLDGFYTFVVGTRNGFGVLRDPIACKPAMLAETDRYVAFGSEYRVLVDLSGIENAKVWEPAPSKVYFWGHDA
jgi:methylamine---glutamate N-methyltransferase subunit A